MKHIALLKSGASSQGGLEKYANRIALGFLQAGARVSILTTGAYQTPLSAEISLVRAPVMKWPAFIRMEQFDRFSRSWMAEHKPDLIFGMDRNRQQTHIRAGNGVHAAYLESRALTEGTWKAFTCRFNPLHRKIIELEKAAFEYPGLQKIFTNSKMVKEQILHWYRTDPSQIEVIHNGVEWEEMEKDHASWPSKKKLFAQKLGLDPDRFYFLFIGNGYLRKGLGQLLQGLARFKEKEFTLLVVGKEKREASFIAQAKKLGLSGRVRFLGPQSSIRPFYQLADALVIPSFYDPFANVTVEALAMGLYVVSSQYNGGKEILNGQTGTIIDELLDPDSMAESLKLALSRKKTPQSAFSVRNQVKHLDFSHQMSQLIKASLHG